MVQRAALAPTACGGGAARRSDGVGGAAHRLFRNGGLGEPAIPHRHAGASSMHGAGSMMVQAESLASLASELRARRAAAALDLTRACKAPRGVYRAHPIATHPLRCPAAAHRARTQRFETEQRPGASRRAQSIAA